MRKHLRIFTSVWRLIGNAKRIVRSIKWDKTRRLEVNGERKTGNGERKRRSQRRPEILEKSWRWSSWEEIISATPLSKRAESWHSLNLGWKSWEATNTVSGIIEAWSTSERLANEPRYAERYVAPRWLTKQSDSTYWSVACSSFSTIHRVAATDGHPLSAAHSYKS